MTGDDVWFVVILLGLLAFLWLFWNGDTNDDEWDRRNEEQA